MGKNRPRIQHEDVYQRVNYLYQAAHECLKRNPQNVSLCRYYIYTLKTITRRLCLHLHPNIKRNMCKRCCVLLIPGVTSIVRTKRWRQKHTVVTCLECGTPRRYVYKPAKIPWIDREEAWDDKIVNGKSVTDRNIQDQKQGEKGAGKQKTSKQESAKTNIDKQDKDSNQNHSGNKKKRKLEEKPGPSKVQIKQSASQTQNESESLYKTVPSTGAENQCELKYDFIETSEEPSTTCSRLKEHEFTGHSVDNGFKGKKASVESSPNPNEKIEVTEERPDEYLYKMRFVQGYYPYLG